MKTVLLTLALAAAAASGAAQAQTARLSDADYIATARCAGLAQGTGASAERFEQTLRDQRRGRAEHIRERAADARRNGLAVARADNAEASAALAACG